MGIAYRVDGAIGLVVTVVDGTVTAADLHDLAGRQRADPEWHAATRSITDARGAVTEPTSVEELEAFAAFYARLRAGDSPLRGAIVAGNDFDQASRYSDNRTEQGSRTIAFNSLETACTWLGVDAGTTAAVIAALRRELRENPPPTP